MEDNPGAVRDFLLERKGKREAGRNPAGPAEISLLRKGGFGYRKRRDAGAAGLFLYFLGAFVGSGAEFPVAVWKRNNKS